MNRLITLSFLLLIVLSPKSQIDSTDFCGNRVFSYGLGYNKLNYKFLSALTYEGRSVNSNFSYFKYIYNGISVFNFETNFSLLTNKQSNSNMYSTNSSLSYSYNHYITSFLRNKLKFYAGALIRTSFDIKYLPSNTNNPIAFIWANNLAFSNIITYKFKIHKFNFNLSNELDVSIVGYTLFAPEFAFSTPYYYREPDHEDFSQSKKHLNITNYLNITNIFNLDIKTTYLDNYTIRLSYRFSGLDATINENDYNYNNQALMLGVIYKLFKY